MSIEGGNRLYWYETRCRASEITADGKQSWKMRLACEGEGEKFRSNPRVSVAADGRLVIENGPVGQAKRQTYVRCEIAKCADPLRLPRPFGAVADFAAIGEPPPRAELRRMRRPGRQSIG